MKHFTSFSLLVVAILASSIALGQMPQRAAKNVNFTDRNTGQAIVGSDIGRFQSFEENVIIVEDGTDDSIVCRYKSVAGNCYRLSVNDGGGHVPVALIDRDTFDNAAAVFRARPNWNICEVINNPWTGWVAQGSIPSGYGVQYYNEVNYCSTGGVAEACANTCPVPSQTRLASVNNGPPPPPACSDSSWSPSTSSVTNGVRFTQYSNCGNTRSRTGSAAPVCVVSSSSPSSSSIPRGQAFTATTNCGTTFPSVGTLDPVCEPNNSWSPSTAGYQIGTTFTQTNGCGRRQTAYGSAPLILTYRFAAVYAYATRQWGATDRSGQICSPGQTGSSETHYLICLPA
ncbi:MAG: hypothetical protein JKY40_10575 [Gammaproteobacteria bacterium]|nr:hypothetical protein [Gammaproteobacteria bacterium]MBL4729730.1 hypothetical protein [Gammaproteobacteria bacterium]